MTMKYTKVIFLSILSSILCLTITLGLWFIPTETPFAQLKRINYQNKNWNTTSCILDSNKNSALLKINDLMDTTSNNEDDHSKKAMLPEDADYWFYYEVNNDKYPTHKFIIHHALYGPSISPYDLPIEIKCYKKNGTLRINLESKYSAMIWISGGFILIAFSILAFISAIIHIYKNCNHNRHRYLHNNEKLPFL